MFLHGDEASSDREFTRGWNAYVRGEVLPDDIGSKEFLEGYNKAPDEYQGRTMKSMAEAVEEEV